MKRQGDESRVPGGHAEERRRQFEASRGLTGRPELDLDEKNDETGKPAEPSEEERSE